MKSIKKGSVGGENFFPFAPVTINNMEDVPMGGEFFRVMLENAQDGVALIDAGGTTRYVSPSVESVLGYTPGESVGMDLFSLIHPDDLAGAKGLFTEALLLPGKVLKAEVRVKHRDGT